MNALAAHAFRTTLGQLPSEVRQDYFYWFQLLQPVKKLKRGVVARLEAIAAEEGIPYRTVRNKFYAFRDAGPEALIDKRKAGPAWWNTDQQIGLPSEDQRLVKQYCERHQRNTEKALQQLRKDWRVGKICSAQPVDPRSGYPRGWSLENLRRYQPSRFELKSVRLGTRAASGLGAMTFTTRVGLWPHSHLMFDDVWHDHFVRVGERNTHARVVELGVLDVFSACRFHFGGKPRLQNAETGQHENLRKADMLLILAAALHTCGGYSPRGTVLMGEHGTAKIYDRAAEILHRYSGGLITVRESGIEGEEQALLGGWRGAGRGNPRFKSPLEAVHRVMHDLAGMLPAQAGLSRDARPETTHGLLTYSDELHKIIDRLPPERRALLIFPLLEYHSQWMPLARHLNDELNARTEHCLEGWSQLGFFTNLYRSDARLEQWIGQEEFLALPPAEQLAISQAVRMAPAIHSRTRRLSPAEVHQRGRGELLAIPPQAVCELLETHFTRAEERVDGAYFVFCDQDISLEPLRYQARILDPEGAVRELPDGERYNVIVNPIDTAALFVMDGRNRFLGIAPQARRISRADTEAFPAAWGEKAHRNAERLAGVRERHAEDVAGIKAMRAHNAAVIEGSPVTPAEKQRARRQRDRIAPLTDFLTPERPAAAEPDAPETCDQSQPVAPDLSDFLAPRSDSACQDDERQGVSSASLTDFL